MVSRSALTGALMLVAAAILIGVLSFTGYIPWTDFSSAIAAVIVAMMPFGLALFFKDMFYAWLKSKGDESDDN